MRRLRVALFAVAMATTLMAFSATAAATTLTSSSGTAYTGKVHAVNEGYIVIKNDIADIECNWTFAGDVEAHGPEREAKVRLTNLIVTGCTNGWTPNVKNMGWMEIAPIHGGPDGTVKWSGAEFEFTHHHWGITCKYATYYTNGRLTGSTTTGSTATLDFGGHLKFVSGSFCGGETEWLGTYAFTGPDFLDVEGPDTIHAVSQEPFMLHSEVSKELDIVCNSTIESEVEIDGSDITAGGKIVKSSSECLGEGDAASVSGTLDFHPIGSGPDGTVTLTSVTVISKRGSTVCYYKAPAIDIGTLKGSSTTFGTAEIAINASLPFYSGSFFCGKQVRWTASYEIEVPDFVNVST